MNHETEIKNYANQLERASWFLTLFAMMTQLSSEVAFPSYNVALGFWGAYCSYTRQGRATFGFITFGFLGVIMDIIFCSINSASSSIFTFSLTMLMYALYFASLFFSSIGGAHSLESSHLNNSAYESLAASNTSASGGYFPPDSSAMMESHNSFTAGNESNL